MLTWEGNCGTNCGIKFTACLLSDVSPWPGWKWSDVRGCLLSLWQTRTTPYNFRGEGVEMGAGKESERMGKLEQERKQTVAELARLRDALKVEVDPDADEGDPDLIEREKVMALVQIIERRLDSIDYALRRMDEGTYGICERCRLPIDPGRLEAVPEAVLCVKCKSVVERQP